MSDPARADPFGGDLDLSDFAPAPPRKPEAQKVREVSEANHFPSRAAEKPKAPPRRRRTGRNVQINIKATAETIARFTALADARGLAFGELLEEMVARGEAER